MDMVEFFAGRAGIETKIPDIMEMRIRDMDDDFLDEIDGRLDNIVTNLIRMVVIIPVDHVGFLIIADDAAFSDAGTADIAYIVRDASVDVRTVIFVLEIIIGVLGTCIYIESVRMFPVQGGPVLFERRAHFLFDQAQELVLKGLAKSLEIKMCKIFEPALSGRIDKLRDEGMDVRVPFEIPAKGVECGDHTEMFAVAVVLQGIVCGRDMFFPELSNDGFIDQGSEGVSGSNEEDVQIPAVSAEPVAETVGDGEDDMAVAGVEAEGGNTG